MVPTVLLVTLRLWASSPHTAGHEADRAGECEDDAPEDAEVFKKAAEKRWPDAGMTNSGIILARAVKTTWRCQPRQAAAFEVIEAELVLEFLVLLFDRPSLMGQMDQCAQRGRGREIHQVAADALAASEFPFAEQPDFWRESSFRPPIVRGVSRSVPIVWRLPSYLLEP